MTEQDYIDYREMSEQHPATMATRVKDDSGLIDTFVKAGMFAVVCVKGAAKLLRSTHAKRLDAEKAVAACTDWDEVDGEGNTLEIHVEPRKSVIQKRRR